MNKKFIFAAALAAAVSTGASAANKGNKQDKVKIVHNGKVIEVNGNALDAHLAHGDELYVETPPPAEPPAYPPPAEPPAYPPPAEPPAPPAYPPPAEPPAPPAYPPPAEPPAYPPPPPPAEPPAYTPPPPPSYPPPAGY